MTRKPGQKMPSEYKGFLFIQCEAGGQLMYWLFHPFTPFSVIHWQLQDFFLCSYVQMNEIYSSHFSVCLNTDLVNMPFNALIRRGRYFAEIVWSFPSFWRHVV